MPAYTKGVGEGGEKAIMMWCETCKKPVETTSGTYIDEVGYRYTVQECVCCGSECVREPNNCVICGEKISPSKSLCILCGEEIKSFVSSLAVAKGCADDDVLKGMEEYLDEREG